VKITDALLAEHAVFYAQFEYLNHSIPVADTLPLVKSQGAMLAAALASHANLEDELLFSALEPYVGPIGPLAVMRMEHDQIEGALERLPATQDLDEARTLLLQLIEIAREHFAREEQILYPLASRSLTIEALTDLGAQWAARRLIVLR
jgi:hemerythrin-like domain-containing protein